MNFTEATETLDTYGYGTDRAQIIIAAAEADEDGFCDGTVHVDADLANGQPRSPRFSYRVGPCVCAETEAAIYHEYESGAISADGQVYTDAETGL